MDGSDALLLRPGEDLGDLPSSLRIDIRDPGQWAAWWKANRPRLKVQFGFKVPTITEPLEALLDGWKDAVKKKDDVRKVEILKALREHPEAQDKRAVKLMLKWPGLHYSTSAFAPKYYPQSIIDYANTRGADKIIYAGYFPMGLSLERIMSDMQHVPFDDDVWPKFLRGNAARVLKLD